MAFRIMLQACLIGLLLAAPVHAAPDRVSVRVGVFENAPIVTLPADAPPAGIAIDMIRWVAERENWQVSYVPDSFDRLVERLERGEIDLLVGLPTATNAQRASSSPGRV